MTQTRAETTLPTPHLRPDRDWQGQRFVLTPPQVASGNPSASLA